MSETLRRKPATHAAALAAFLAAAMLAFVLLQAGAQTIGHKERNQQARIARGVRTGQLTPREARHLQRREAALNREERKMRQRNGGTLTAGDRAKLQRQQSRLSRSIYRDKHKPAVH